LGVFEITAGKANYINRQQQLLSAKEEYESQLNNPPGPPIMKGIYSDPAFSGTAYPDPGTPDTIAPRGWPQKPVFAPAGGPPGAPIQWGDNVTNENVESGFGFVGTGNIEEKLCYFYHSNHLGSSNYLTNARGDVTQFIAYIPFGETFAEQHSDWDSPYKFNGKEMDNETGLYYYGARYYDPKVSIWMGVDPQAGKYPFLSPYVYVANNPVLNVDNNGGKIWISFEVKNWFGRTKIQAVEYSETRLYGIADGNEYTGKNNYVIKVRNDLIQLSTDNTELCKRINDLDKSDKIHIIRMTDYPGQGNSHTADILEDRNKGVRTGSLVKYDPDNKTTVRGTRRTPRVGLAHELLGHSYDSDRGTTRMGKVGGIKLREVDAVKAENLSREATDDPLRKQYAGKDIPQHMLDDTP